MVYRKNRKCWSLTSLRNFLIESNTTNSSISIMIFSLLFQSIVRDIIKRTPIGATNDMRAFGKIAELSEEKKSTLKEARAALKFNLTTIKVVQTSLFTSD